MTTPKDISDTPAPGEYLAECPECGAQAIGYEWETSPPGHLHDIETGRPYFVEYEPAVEKPKRGRPRKLEPVPGE